jgi:HSP20 family molecular chaperone IbpA
MHPRFRSFYHSHDATSLTHDATSFTPPVDIFVTDTQTIIHASLPGAQRSDLSVAYDASRSILRMAGVVHRPGVDEEMYQALLVGERGRHVGVFEREVPISHNVAVEGVEARLVDGVLRVTLPRVEGEVQQPDEEMDEVEKEGAREESWVSSECTIEGKEQEEHEEEEEVEREYVKVDIQ